MTPLHKHVKFNYVYTDCFDLLMEIVGLSSEWAKAKACADRWEEEVMLLDEEMRRVLEFCNWRAAWWTEQVSHRKDLPGPLTEGLQAYAVEQADMEQRIHAAWATKWRGARKLAQPLLEAIATGKPVQEAVVGPTDLEIHENYDSDSDFE